MTDYKKEREIAEAATPGPWKYEEVKYDVDCAPPSVEHWVILSNGEDSTLLEEEDARYIAMAHPKRYLELLDTIESMKCCGNCGNYKEKRNIMGNSEGHRCAKEPSHINRPWIRSCDDDWTPRGEKE